MPTKHTKGTKKIKSLNFFRAFRVFRRQYLYYFITDNLGYSSCPVHLKSVENRIKLSLTPIVQNFRKASAPPKIKLVKAP